MSPKLFGVDFAKTMARGLGKHLLDATLIVVTQGTRTEGQLTGGTNPTETPYSCKGFVESYAAFLTSDLTAGVDHRVTLLAGTLAAGIEPKQNDKVTIEGRTYWVERVGRDPAAATFLLYARGQ